MSTRYFQQTTVGGVPLNREISIRTTSDAATIPDNPGPGRTLDKALARGGERFERAITWILSRAGRGPNSSMKDIMRAVYESMMTPRPCYKYKEWCCGYWGPPDEITPYPTTCELPVVCEWLVYAANAKPCCPKCGARMTPQYIDTPRKPFKKLVKLMSSTNKSSCYISLQLLTLLVTIFPSSREVFAHMGAWDVLHEVSKRMSDQLDVDPLLVYSRCLLMPLSDVETLSLGKQLEEQGSKHYCGSNHGTLVLIVSKLIDCFRHPEKMILALTVAHRYPHLLYGDFHPVLNTIYPTLMSRLTSSSDPVEVAVLTDSLYHVINMGTQSGLWLIEIIKTQPQLLEDIPYRLRWLIDGLPARYEQGAVDHEQYWGRRVNAWRRAIWRYDPDDPEGEPDDDDKFFKAAARDDGEYGNAKIDGVWWEAPVWETCDRRKWRLEGREEQRTEDEERRGRDGRRPRAHSTTITTWPRWMKERQMDEATEWKAYWEDAESVNFTGWPRKVAVWLEMEPEPENKWMPWRDQDRMIYWTKLSTRMRSRSVD